MKNDLVSLLGLVRENRFSYARALIDPDMHFSMLSIDVAEDLRCREHTEDLGTFNVRTDEKTYKVLDMTPPRPKGRGFEPLGLEC
ncbi:MAG: hypothetical protein LM581_05235 [Desulfurococcales archaeon]|nr:hypothetical protein [Desulfurococcales archaeon]